VNLDFILNNFPASRLGWLRESLRDHQSYVFGLLFGILVVLLSTYGLLLCACFVAVWLSVRWRLSMAWTLFPLFVLANHLFVALCMDSNHGTGDTFEIIHKTFVFPYFAVTAWTAATLGSRFGSSLRSRSRDLVLLGTTGAALLGVCQAGKSVQSGISWAKEYTDLALPKGFYDAAQFIRAHTSTDAVVQSSENDAFAMLAALGERKAFVVRYTEPPFVVAPEEAKRMQDVETLLSLPSADSVKELAGVLGVDWLLVAETRHPPWADQLTPEFESQGYRLYHLRPSAPGAK
jgi:hypothetical protein